MSKPTDFIFVRHGQSQANANRVMNSPDSSLTDLGIEQAKQTAAALYGHAITTIAHSPFRRAKQTAEIIAHELNIDEPRIHVIDDLRERDFGELESQPLDREPLLYYSDDDDILRFEPRTALFDRMAVCLENLKQIADKERVLVVGHSISGFYLAQIASRKPSPESFDIPPRMPNASFIKITIEDKD